MEAIQLVKYSGSRQLLEALLRFPKRQFTINELAREAGVPYASAWRLVQKWEPAGIIETGRVGKSVTIRLHKSEYLDLVASLLKISMSPQAFTARSLQKMLTKEKRVKKAYLFGSVARGGEKPASDIDIALLAEKSFDASQLALDIYYRYGTKVVPIAFSDRREFKEFVSGKKGKWLK